MSSSIELRLRVCMVAMVMEKSWNFWNFQKIHGISGKVMEFRLKLTKVMEKS